VKVILKYSAADSTLLGSRFFLSYSGAAPSGANCVTLAGDIAAAWNTDLASLVSGSVTLVEVDVIDIATDTGASGQWTGDHGGGDSSGNLPGNVATNIEFDIARRYRGGKPRMFLPAPGIDRLDTQQVWEDSYVTDCNTGIAAFFTAIAALTVGSMGTLAHVNLSYYKGFTNVTNSSGRERAAPTYRSAALVDSVTGYATKAVVGSQRRRRSSTSY
jgi:hypothetical protein